MCFLGMCIYWHYGRNLYFHLNMSFTGHFAFINLSLTILLKREKPANSFFVQIRIVKLQEKIMEKVIVMQVAFQNMQNLFTE